MCCLDVGVGVGVGVHPYIKFYDPTLETQSYKFSWDVSSLHPDCILVWDSSAESLYIRVGHVWFPGN